MSSSQETVKKVTLDVEAQADVQAGLTEVKSTVRRTLDEIDRDASARIQASKAAIASAQKVAAQATAAAEASKPRGKKGASDDEKGALDSLKGTLGEESDFGKTLKAFKGAGVVAGLAIAADMAAKITTSLREAVVEYSSGQKSAGQIADSFIRQVPVLGNIYTTGRNIREMFDGTAAAVAKMEASAKAVEGANAAIDTVIADKRRLVEAFEKERITINLQISKDAINRDLPTWMRDAAARHLDLEVQLKVNADQLDEQIKQAKQDALGKQGETLKKINESTDPAEKARLQGMVDGAIAQAEKGVRAAAAARDAALKQQFGEQTGVNYDGGRNAIVYEQNRRNSEMRDTLGRDTVDAIGDRSDTGKALLANRIASLREEAALGDQLKGFEADRLAIQQKYVEEAESLQQVERTGATEGERAEAARRLGSLKGRKDAELADASQKQADAAREQAITRQGEAVRIRADAMRDEAVTGDKLKSFDAERLEIAQRFLEVRRQLLKTQDDPNASPEARQAAKTALAGLAARQQAAEADADQRKANAAQDDHISTANSLLAVQIDNMQTLASLGDKQAGIEAQKLQIHEKFVQQQRDLDRLLQRSDLQADDRARAQSLRNSIEKREQAEVLKLLHDQMDTKTSALSVGGEDVSVFAARAADAARQSNPFADPNTAAPGAGAAAATQQITTAITTALPPAISQAVTDAIARNANDPLVQVVKTLADKVDQLVMKWSGGRVPRTVTFPA